MASETARKYADIRKEYEQKWLTKKYKGKPIYSDDYIFLKLGEKFYLSSKTIENIVFYRTRLIAG